LAPVLWQGKIFILHAGVLPERPLKSKQRSHEGNASQRQRERSTRRHFSKDTARPYLASRQLSPTPISTTNGTSSAATPSISRFTSRETASTSSSGHSKTSSSCTCSS